VPAAPAPSFSAGLPDALTNDADFMSACTAATATYFHFVNVATPATGYALVAGGLRGPASTVYVLKFGLQNGDFQQATWWETPVRYPPVHHDAALWLVSQRGGYANPSTSNLLLNSGFESNGGAGQVAASWTRSADVGAENWAALSGAWGMAFYSWWPQKWGEIRQDVSNVTAGAVYRFSLPLYRDSSFVASTIELSIDWLDLNGVMIGRVSTSLVGQLSAQWQTRRVTAVAPAGARAARCRAYCAGITSGGALKLDDAALTLGIAATSATVRLVFDPARDDSPFLPRWEVAMGTAEGTFVHDVFLGVAPSGDTDSDGMSDADELYAGTDPKDPDSALVAYAAPRGAAPPNAFVISWESATTRTYGVTGWFEPTTGTPRRVATGIPATPPVNTATDNVTSARSYYRVHVE